MPTADLRGLTPAIVTPFDDQGEVDFDSLISYVLWMKSIPGVVAIVLNSHAGEGSALTADERAEIVKTVKAEVADLHVVAGVIGRRKFSYDLWGDTVNTASRMQTHGVTDAIQVTRETYQRLRGAYVFEERGRIDVKGKGIVTTYLLTGRKSASRSPASAEAGGGSARSP